MARILVAEDSAALRAVLAFLLRSREHDVVEASNGREALDLALAQPPDLVLLDVLMPLLSGFEVCARLKSTPETRDIPILILTSVARDAGKDDAHWKRASGADDFMPKPFKAHELLERVDRLLGAPRAAPR